jgi:hypothetical protein
VDYDQQFFFRPCHLPSRSAGFFLLKVLQVFLDAGSWQSARLFGGGCRDKLRNQEVSMSVLRDGGMHVTPDDAAKMTGASLIFRFLVALGESPLTKKSVNVHLFLKKMKNKVCYCLYLVHSFFCQSFE